MVVLVLPRAELADELRSSLEGHPPVEFLLVGAMTALDLAIGLRAAGRDVLVSDAEIVQVPGEVGPPFGAVVPAEWRSAAGEAASLVRDRQSQGGDDEG